MNRKFYGNPETHSNHNTRTCHHSTSSFGILVNKIGSQNFGHWKLTVSFLIWTLFVWYCGFIYSFILFQKISKVSGNFVNFFWVGKRLAVMLSNGAWRGTSGMVFSDLVTRGSILFQFVRVKFSFEWTTLFSWLWEQLFLQSFEYYKDHENWCYGSHWVWSPVMGGGVEVGAECPPKQAKFGRKSGKIVKKGESHRMQKHDRQNLRVP